MPKIIDEKQPDGSKKWYVQLDNGTLKDADSLPHAQQIYSRAIRSKSKRKEFRQMCGKPHVSPNPRLRPSN